MGGACFGGCLKVLNFEKWREWFNKPLAIFSSLLPCSQLTWRLLENPPKLSIRKTSSLIYGPFAMSPHVILNGGYFSPGPRSFGISGVVDDDFGLMQWLRLQLFELVWATGQVRWRPGGCFVLSAPKKWDLVVNGVKPGSLNRW